MVALRNLVFRAVMAAARLAGVADVSRAADIKVSATRDCKLTLEGPIRPGDADKLAAALAALPGAETPDGGTVTLCLDSPGGSYDEGLKVISLLLKHTNVATIVERGAQCYSACAFVFLAGNSQLSEDGELGPDRTLDAGGTLGFHAPYIKSDAGTTDPVQTAETYKEGVHAIAKMLEIDRRNLFPRGLLAKALQVGPDYLLYVDTVEKAGVWSIKLKGYRPPETLSEAMLDQACRNKDIWTNFAHSFLGRPADDPDELHGLRQSDFPEIRGTNEPIAVKGGAYRKVLDMFGYEATSVCVVDLLRRQQKRWIASFALMPADQPTPPPEQFASQVKDRLDDPGNLEAVSDPLWYVFAPSTTLKSIAAP